MTGAGESRGREAVDVDELEGQRSSSAQQEEKEGSRLGFLFGLWKVLEDCGRKRRLGSTQVLNRSSAQPKLIGDFFFYLNRYRVPVPVPGPHFLDPAPEPVATGSGILEPVPEPV